MPSTYPSPAHRPAEVDAVVVGAGFSGLYAVHRLRGLGLSYRAFEQERTWPGAAGSRNSR